MKHRVMVFLLPAIFLLLAPSMGAAEPRYPHLQDGREVNGILHITRENAWYRTFVFDIPESAVGFRIKVLEAAGDVDLFLKHGSDITDYSESDFFSETDAWLEELNVYKFYENSMPSGRYYLDVVYQKQDLPRHKGEVQFTVPFQLVLEVFDGASVTPLVPGRRVNAVLDDEGGYVKTFGFEVAGSDGFRIDVLDTPGDVDLYLSRDEPAQERNEYEMIVDTLAGRESLIMEPGNEDFSGPWYLTVFEAVETEFPVPFSLILSEGTDVPDAAPAPPALPGASGIMDKGRVATVQLIGPEDMGSGCLIGNNGYIVTNAHVVLDMNGVPVDEMIVSVSVNPYEATVEAFSAKVLDTVVEDDLALLRIVADRWGRPLDPGLRFPGWRLGDPGELHLGDPLLVMGYPWIGTGMSRLRFTVTRGILSGGDLTPRGLLLKTDALLSGGGSGGAVTDGRGRLLGLPSFTIGEDGGQFGYFIPVDRLPRDWRDSF